MKSISEILRNEHDFEHDFRTRKMKKTLFSKPKIYHGGENYDLSKRWYVYFSFRDINTDKLVRQPNVYLQGNNIDNKRERLKYYKALQKAIHESLINGWTPYISEEKEKKKSYTIISALDFALKIKQPTITERTYSDYKSIVKKFKNFLVENRYSNLGTFEIEKKHVLVFLNDLIVSKVSPKTYNNYRVTLLSLFSILKENGLILDNFISEIKPLKGKPKRHKSFSPTLLKELLDLIKKEDEQLYFFIQFVSYNFLRPVEVVRLKWGDLKLKEEVPYLEVKAKNKLVKTKLIPNILYKEIIKKVKGGINDFIFITNDKGIDTNEVNRRNFFSKRFKRFKKQLNLGDEYTIYSFRHTFITMLYREIRKELTELETYDLLMKITGHATLKALKSYLRDVDAELPQDYSKYFKNGL